MGRVEGSTRARGDGTAIARRSVRASESEARRAGVSVGEAVGGSQIGRAHV